MCVLGSAHVCVCACVCVCLCVLSFFSFAVSPGIIFGHLFFVCVKTWPASSYFAVVSFSTFLFSSGR